MKISEKEVQNAVENSWEKISKNYVPDMILAISKGGDTIGEALSTISLIPVTKILIQRPDRKPLYRKLAKINKHLAWLVYELLFLYDKPKVMQDINLPHNKNILIVDDGIHTGKTIHVCLAFLKKFNPQSVYIFSLMDISKEKLADYFVYDRKISFPWSENYEN